MAKSFGVSDLASLGFGQIGPLLDTMDMMSKTWSAMTLPSTMSPTLSIEELDKRIGDLRTIERWLSLNQNMLRTTIQALEIQRGTIATLRSFGKAMGSPQTDAQAFDPERLAAWFAATQKPDASSDDDGQPPPRAGANDPAPAGEPAAATDKTAQGGAPAADPAEVNQLAQAWWNMLNEQFQQVTSAALGGMASASDALKADPDASSPAAGDRSAAGAKSTSGGRRGAAMATALAATGGRKRARRAT